MAYLGDKNCLIIDYGTFTHVAAKLAESFKTVFYHNPSWKGSYPKFNNYILGDGIPNVVRSPNLWDTINENQIDVIGFTDIYDGDLQNQFKKMGYPVFGSAKCEELEIYRDKAKELFKEIGLQVAPYKVIRGITKLREYLKSVDDCWVKTNIFRGNFETFHHEGYNMDKHYLDHLAHVYGAYQEEELFTCEKPIENCVEIGYDGFVINGKFPEKTITGIEIKGDCYDKDTEVLTDEGWKAFKDLSKNEKILTLNIADKRHIKMEFQKPTNYITKPFKGEMIYIDKDCVNVCVTPGHNMLVQDGVQNEDGEVMTWGAKIERCGPDKHTFKRGKRILRLQKMEDLIKRNKRFSLFQPKGIYTPDNPSKDRIRIGNHKIGKFILAEFLGAYLSEGYVRKRGNWYEIIISQFKYVREFEDIINKMPIKFSKCLSGFYSSDRDLGEYLLQFGKAKDKFVPQWIKDSGPDTINLFLNSYCLGDGSFLKRYKAVRKDSPRFLESKNGYKELASRRFHTASSQMANDLQELLIKVGSVAESRVAKVYYDKTNNVDSLMYCVNEKVITRKNYIFPKDIQYVPYNDYVYCVTVPNHIIMTRRNGKSLWCGNCYLGVYLDYKNLPNPIKEVNSRLAPIFEVYGYTGSFSDEIRMVSQKEYYLTDPCCRFPSPPGDLYTSWITNFADVFWEIANGNIITPICKEKYGCQIQMHSKWATTDTLNIEYPAEIAPYVKPRNEYMKNGIPYSIPQGKEGGITVASVWATANTKEAAIKLCMGRADQVKCFDIEYSKQAIDEIPGKIAELEKRGVKIF